MIRNSLLRVLKQKTAMFRFTSQDLHQDIPDLVPKN